MTTEKKLCGTAGQFDSITQKFVASIEAKDGDPIYKLPIPDARNVLDSLQSEPIEKLPVMIEDHTISGGPTGVISIRIVRPEDSWGKLPALMYFHGGGWILGNKNTHDRLIREIAVGSECAVVFVEFTPSPEARYPVAIEQAYAATKYIAEQGERFNLDGSRLAVAGDSVGGNMATVVTILAKERSGPKIDCQVLFYPVTDASMDTPSYQQFADGPWLTKAAMEWFWNAYEPNVENRNKYTLSPLKASLDQLKGLPEATIITAENDVLRDEGEAYSHKLMEAGVRVTSARFAGTIHDFVMLNALAKNPSAHCAISQANASIRKVFGISIKKRVATS